MNLSIGALTWSASGATQAVVGDWGHMRRLIELSFVAVACVVPCAPGVAQATATTVCSAILADPCRQAVATFERDTAKDGASAERHHTPAKGTQDGQARAK
jgi:hypothetical protein